MSETNEQILPLSVESALDFIRVIADHCFTTALTKGWWDKYDVLSNELRIFLAPEIIASKLMLSVGEHGEALEELRAHHPPEEIYFKDGKPEGFPIEVADAIIRLMDLCVRYNIDLVKAMRIKMRYNQSRPIRHGGKSI